MVIAFLDLLGFTWLMEKDIIVASDNLNAFNNTIKIKHYDNLCNEDKTDFSINHAITAFNHLISVSDSLIIGSNNPDIFIRQLCTYIACVFIGSSGSFKKPFEKLEGVMNNKDVDVKIKAENGKYSYEFEPHRAFPIMFRGGISSGEDVNFSKQLGFFEEKPFYGLNVFGQSYVEAVNLEKRGKGSRLFCNKKFVDSLSSEGRCAIRCISEDKALYEIVWTYYACEATERCTSNKMENVDKRINKLLLPPAKNLYNYFHSNKDKNKEEDQQEYKHYEELILLICRGILKYASDNNLDIDSVFKKLKEKISDLPAIKLTENEIDSFLN